MIPQAPAQVNLQYMLNASRAVLTRPSVSTFEEFERDDLNWAAIYIVIGAVIAAILSALGTAINPPDLSELPPELRGAAQPGIVGSVVGGVTGALIGYFIWLGLVYFVGRLFGGQGQFGELAFDVSLYWTPLSVATSLLNVVQLPLLTGLALLAAFVYNVYLTYLSIQSGMNLPRDKALYVMLVIVGVFVALICGLALLVAALGVAIGGLSQ
jgi:hypothetical protein